MENKTLKRGSLRRGSLRRGMKETRTFPSAKASRESEAAACRTEPTRAGTSPTSGGSRESPGGGLEVTGRGPRRGGKKRPLSTGPHPGLPFLPQDSLWLQEVSNLSEWLSPGPGP